MDDNIISTFGCRMNAFESQYIRGILEKLHMKKYIVVNTCTITAEGERQCRQELRKLKKQNPDFHLIITGCAGQLHGGLFASMPEVDFVIGNENKLKDDVYLKIDKYFQDLASGQPVDKSAIQASIYADCIPENADLKCNNDFDLIDNFSDRSRAFVPIHTGCNHFCAFCIVPFTRGKFCSYDPEYIVNQVKKFNENGYHEVVLTGIDITDFGKDIRGQNAVDTLGKLCKSILRNTQIERLRLSSVDVAEIDTDIMDLVANEPRFMPYFHISLQSGDDNVLRRMRRRHRAKEVYDFCNEVVKYRPDAAFGADIITGFPGETDEEFANSLAMVERAPISYVHAFPYSRREKTLAYLMDDNVPKQVKKERLHKLIDTGEKNLQRLYKSMGGRAWKVIIEHNGIARAENFAQIVIDDTFEPGTLAEIKVAFDGKRLVVDRSFK